MKNTTYAMIVVIICLFATLAMLGTANIMFGIELILDGVLFLVLAGCFATMAILHYVVANVDGIDELKFYDVF